MYILDKRRAYGVNPHDGTIFAWKPTYDDHVARENFRKLNTADLPWDENGKCSVGLHGKPVADIVAEPVAKAEEKAPVEEKAVNKMSAEECKAEILAKTGSEALSDNVTALRAEVRSLRAVGQL
jgi:polyhydroxyalkanoate synthesis regulator phasin